MTRRIQARAPGPAPLSPWRGAAPSVVGAVLGALAASPDCRGVQVCSTLARRAPAPRLEDGDFGPALLPPRVGPWVGGVVVDVRAAEVVCAPSRRHTTIAQDSTFLPFSVVGSSLSSVDNIDVNVMLVDRFLVWPSSTTGASPRDGRDDRPRSSSATSAHKAARARPATCRCTPAGTGPRARRRP